DHLPEFTLRNGDLMILRITASETEQRSGEARGQIKTNNVLDLLASVTQTPAEDFDQLDGDIRLAMHQGDEVAPVDNKQFRILDCHRIRGALTTVEKRDLSEDLPRPDQIEHRTLAFTGRHGDLHLSGADGIETGALVAFQEHCGAALDPL